MLRSSLLGTQLKQLLKLSNASNLCNCVGALIGTSRENSKSAVYGSIRLIFSKSDTFDAEQKKNAMSSSGQDSGSGGNGKDGETLGEKIEKFISSNQVALFSKSWCPYCKKAKTLLDDNNAKYGVMELDLTDGGDLIQAKLLELSGQKTVPNIFINQKHIGGFSDLKSIDDAGSLMDLIGSSQTGLPQEKPNYLNIGEKVDEFIKTNKIAFFSKSWCPYCTKAKSLLDGHNAKYGVLELDLTDGGDLIQAKLLELSGQKTVPNIFINQKHIGGFSDLKSIDDAGSLMDLIGSSQTGLHLENPNNLTIGQKVDDFIKMNKIAFFSKSWCPYCTKAKSLLDGHNAKYGVLELDLTDGGDLIQAKLLELSGQKTVPNIFINQKHIGGFSDLKSIDDAGSLMDLIGSSQTGLPLEKPNNLTMGQKVDEFIKTNKIAFFSKSWCPYCTKAKTLLDGLNAKYGVLELDLTDGGDLIQAKLLELSGQKTVPNIFINQKHIGGFSDLKSIDDAGSLMDLLGSSQTGVPQEKLNDVTIGHKVDEFIKTNKIAVFSKSWCPYCTKAKDLLSSQGKHFNAWELDLDDAGVKIQGKLHELSEQKTVPNIFINGKHIGGFSDLSHYDTAGLLDELIDQKNLDFEYDLIVIGGGSGGISAAKEAAASKKKVALCDFVTPSPRGTIWGLGGTCVNVGCIPKKLMHRAAIIRQDMKDAADFGWDFPIERVSHDWGTMVDNIQIYISSLNDSYKEQLAEVGVIYFNGNASFVDNHTVKIISKDGLSREIQAKNIVVAVGGRPTHLDVPNAQELCITSDDIFSLKTPPGKTLVIGASYIALECAGFLKGLGYDVTVMVRSILLRGFDQECADKIEKYMDAYGVEFLKQCIPTLLEKYIQEDGKTKIRVKGKFESGDLFDRMYDTVLVAVGRTALTANLNLGHVGVHINPRNGKIIVNEKDQTSVKNIFAVGDVIERPELTPVAIQAGKLLAKRLYSSGLELMNYSCVPTTVFTPLEYGCVGLSEEAAIDAHGKDKIEIYHTIFTPLEYSLRSWGASETNLSFAKLICLKEQKEQNVIGLHILAPNAGEITQGFAFGVQLRLTKSQFDRLVGIHPTVAEVFTTLKVTKASGDESAAKGC